MAIELNDNIYVNGGKPSDAKRLNPDTNAPYTSQAEVFSTIPLAERPLGQVFVITEGGVNKEYWFKDDVTTLVAYGTSYTFGNGLEDDGNGNVSIGDITEDTTINAENNLFRIINDGVPFVSGELFFALDGGNGTAEQRISGDVFLGLNNKYTRWFQNSSNIQFGYTDNDILRSNLLFVSESKLSISTAISKKGAVYTSDSLDNLDWNNLVGDDQYAIPHIQMIKDNLTPSNLSITTADATLDSNYYNPNGDIHYNNAIGGDLTIEDDFLDINQIVLVWVENTGVPTFLAGTGVALSNINGDFTGSAQYGNILIKKTSAGNYNLAGDLTT